MNQLQNADDYFIMVLKHESKQDQIVLFLHEHGHERLGLNGNFWVRYVGSVVSVYKAYD